MGGKQGYIAFHFLKEQIVDFDEIRTQRLIAELLREEGRELDFLDVIFCDDEYLYNLNISYLNHDTLTDVISFDYNQNADNLSEPENEVELPGIAGDIYISLDRARENASNFNVSFIHEILRLIVHGCLHFCGYKDSSEPERKEMRLLEDKYLATY